MEYLKITNSKYDVIESFIVIKDNSNTSTIMPQDIASITQTNISIGRYMYLSFARLLTKTSKVDLQL